MDENLSHLLNHFLPQAAAEEGNTLPQADDAMMWQALMLIQPTEEALANAKEAILLTIEDMEARGETLPNPDSEVIHKIAV